VLDVQDGSDQEGVLDLPDPGAGRALVRASRARPFQVRPSLVARSGESDQTPMARWRLKRYFRLE